MLYLFNNITSDYNQIKHWCNVKTLNYIYENFDRGNVVRGIYFDLSQTFHRVDHYLLCNKLYSYGVRWICLDYVRSYIFDRAQVR